jgi:asparagine synthase (glutamine-hydrolysing)
MCRIAAIISHKTQTLNSNITAMTDAMHRGGPDDSGSLINEDLGYALGQRRLSIIDLSPTGHQPMIDDSNQIEIVFNGEIYNYQELKAALVGKGHTFKSQSDTEVLIKGYSEWGAEMLHKLKGMFAFVLIDKKINTLFAARDHAGIKPLYIARNNDEIFFSSEIRGIKAINTTWEENPNWKIWFLTFGFLPEPITTLQNVKPLPRGHYITINLETREEVITAYAQYKYSNNASLNYQQATQQTKTLVDAAVKRHLIADVPIGVFLSGGIDSSILAIIAQQQRTSPVETISIYFDDEKYSEKEYQEIIIKQTGVKHHSYKITKEEFLSSWDDIYASLDQPSTDAINTHFICKYAKENGLKVVLSGLGADEIFGGYPSFTRAAKYNTFKRLAVLNKMLPSFVLGSYPKKKFGFLNKQINASEYLLYRGLFTPKDVARILEIKEQDVWNEITNFSFQEDISQLSPQNKAAYFETAIYMQSQLLKDSDMQSMWHSLELRVPFLDKDLMEFVNDLHPNIKFKTNHEGKPKPLLVDAYINELPQAIWNRPKQGFTFPFENWFQTMKVFANPKYIPNWVYSLFMNKKINFARLWAVFLAYGIDTADAVHNLD